MYSTIPANLRAEEEVEEEDDEEEHKPHVRLEPPRLGDSVLEKWLKAERKHWQKKQSEIPRSPNHEYDRALNVPRPEVDGRIWLYEVSPNEWEAFDPDVFGEQHRIKGPFHEALRIARTIASADSKALCIKLDGQNFIDVDGELQEYSNAVP